MDSYWVMLLLDRSNLRIELTRDGIGKHRTNRHVVIVRLMFTRHNRDRIELADRLRFVSVVAFAQIIFRRAVFDYGRPARNYVGVAL